ncbi:MAG: hypothetical protein IH588_19600, partial [Anaerolineales bacterium]|nr:hypothetical protein [Anaerolineales bacterium]
MGKRRRKKLLDTVTDFINRSEVHVIQEGVLVAKMNAAVNAKEAVGILSVSKDEGVNDVYLAALFTVLRDAMQDRVMADIGRAGDYRAKVSANDASQLELTDE